jgi:hypothetical protein
MQAWARPALIGLAIRIAVGRGDRKAPSAPRNCIKNNHLAGVFADTCTATNTRFAAIFERFIAFLDFSI